MKAYSIRFTPEAARLLSTLHPDNKKLIKATLHELKKNPYLGDELQEELFSFRSLNSLSTPKLSQEREFF